MGDGFKLKRHGINPELENTSEYFMNLGSQNRLGILLHLQNQDYRLSDISKEIDSTAQEVYRNINRLMKSKMVEKTNSNTYRITDIGKILISMTSIPMFIDKNRSFFNEHALDELPLKFMKRIGDLEDSELISGVTSVLDRITRIYENSEEFIDDAISESFDDFDEIILKKISKKIPYRHIIGKNQKEQKNRQSNLDQNGYYEAIEKGIIKRKLLSRVNFTLIINEKESAVIFPGRDKNPDFRMMFYGTGKEFHDWCVDLYEYCWQLGKNYNRKPLKVKKYISK